ncbi:MAG TPA: sulfotransferase domain-containing protein [Candidatus Binataceae bacterium]|jgi:hypothetical protein|nr:sulfotransferase domain-containing protein [Candidatus Binataceae bacterium]
MSAAHQLPDVIVAGVPRSGTTWLHEVLQGHVGLPYGIKETHFFTVNYDLGLDWYRRHFADCPPDRPVVEVAPIYFDSSEAAERIRRDIPHCRIVCSFRDPIDRMYSHYRYLRRAGFIGKRTFEQAMAAQEQWADQPGNILNYTRYGTHFRRWLELFGRERVLAVVYEDLVADPQTYLNTVTDFIGAARIDLASSKVSGVDRINAADHALGKPHLLRRARRLERWLNRRQMYRTLKPLWPVVRFIAGRAGDFEPPSPETIAMLRERFRPEVEMLEELTGRDFTAWKGTAAPPAAALTARGAS